MVTKNEKNREVTVPVVAVCFQCFLPVSSVLSLCSLFIHSFSSTYPVQGRWGLEPIPAVKGAGAKDTANLGIEPIQAKYRASVGDTNTDTDI